MNISRFTAAVTIFLSGFFAFLLVYSFAEGRPQDYTLAARIVFASLTGTLIISLKIPSSYRTRLVLVVCSTGLTLLACELFLQFTSGLSTPSGVPFDTRTKREVIREFRNEGLEVYQNYVGQLDRNGVLRGGDVYPLTGLSQTPTIACNELGEWIVYQTDEHGFNNPIGIWGRKPISVVSIGDSYAWGVCVPPERSAPGLIRTAYPNSLNLGVSGTSSLDQLAVIKEYLGELQPHTVIWFYFEGNDLRDMRESFDTNPFLRRYLESGYRQDLASRQDEVDSFIKPLLNSELAMTKSKMKLRNIIFLSQLRLKVIGLRERESTVCKVPDETFVLFRQIVKQARDHVASWDGELYFVYLPSWPRYGDPGLGCPDFENPLNSRDKVLSIAEGAGLQLVDMSEVFDDHPDPLSLFAFRQHAHYNEDGYKLVSEIVLEKINAAKRP